MLNACNKKNVNLSYLNTLLLDHEKKLEVSDAILLFKLNNLLPNLQDVKCM